MKSNYKKRYLIGDVHHHYVWPIITNHLIKCGNSEIGYFQVGDFGIGLRKIESDSHDLTNLNNLLDKYDSDLYIIRGNHDNPDWFRSKNDDINLIKSKLNRIKFVEDYEVLEINSERILCIGGAISIDRVPRKMRNDSSWFEDEVFVLDYKKLESLFNIDRVITHTSPDFCEPTKFGTIVYEFAYRDGDLISDLLLERRKLTEASKIIMSDRNPNLKSWTNGHFHNSYIMDHRNVRFQCLDVNEFQEF